jgi:hypothetical protein
MQETKNNKKSKTVDENFGDLLGLYFELNPPTVMTFACCSSTLLSQDISSVKLDETIEKLKKTVVESMGKPKRKKGAKEALDEIISSSLEVNKGFYSIAGFKIPKTGVDDLDKHTLIVRNYYNLAHHNVSYENSMADLVADEEISNMIYSTVHQFSPSDHDREIFSCNSVDMIAANFEICYEIFYRWQQSNLAIAKMCAFNDPEEGQKMQRYTKRLTSYMENFAQKPKVLEKKGGFEL